MSIQSLLLGSLVSRGADRLLNPNRTNQFLVPQGGYFGTEEDDDNKDRGIEFKWHNGSSAKLGFFGMDDSDGKFKYIPDATNSSEVFSGSVGSAVFNDVAVSTINGNAVFDSNSTVDGGTF